MENPTTTHSLKLGVVSVPRSVVVAVVSLTSGLHYGLNYGVGNQTGYLLKGLKRFDPTLFANDWLVSETTRYHPTFAYVAQMLYVITPGGLSFAIANVLSIALSCIVIYRIVALLCQQESCLPVFLILMAFLAATETWSVGVSFVFSQTFQPSTIASFALLLGLHEFLKGNYLRSGVVLAAGGLFHANYLILGFPLFGIAHLFLGRPGLLGRLLRQLGPSLLALIPFLPIMIDVSLSPDATRARMIFTTVHGPQHFVPRTFMSSIYVFFAWHILGVVAGWEYLRNDSNRRLRVLFFVQLALITVAMLLTTIVFIPSVSQLLVWRLAPFSVLFAQLIGSAGLAARFLAGRKYTVTAGNTVLTAGAAMCVYVIWHSHYGWHRDLILFLLILVASASIISGLPRRLVDLARERRLLYLSILAIVVWLVGGTTAFRGFVQKSSLVRGVPAPVGELYEWIRENTDVGAMFLTPPGFEGFRLHAQRAVVADWKHIPVVPSDVMEWYRRIELVSTCRNFRGKKEVLAGYKNHDNDSMNRVYESYPYDFAVFYQSQKTEDFSDFKTVFENSRFVVMERLTDHD